MRIARVGSELVMDVLGYVLQVVQGRSSSGRVAVDRARKGPNNMRVPVQLVADHPVVAREFDYIPELVQLIAVENQRGKIGAGILDLDIGI